MVNINAVCKIRRLLLSFRTIITSKELREHQKARPAKIAFSSFQLSNPVKRVGDIEWHNFNDRIANRAIGQFKIDGFSTPLREGRINERGGLIRSDSC